MSLDDQGLEEGTRRDALKKGWFSNREREENWKTEAERDSDTV